MPPAVLPPMHSVSRAWAAEYYADDRDWAEFHAPKPPRTKPGTKRAPANDPGPSEPPKKRRKDDLPPPAVAAAPKRTDAHRPEERSFAPLDLSALPLPSLVAYLVKHDIIPEIHPSPYSAQPTLAPSIFLHPPPHTPPPPAPPAPSAATQPGPDHDRRRSSRLQEDELGTAPGDDANSTHLPPILPDLDTLPSVLSQLVHRHWQTRTVREPDTIAGFVWAAQRARERTLLTASSAGHG